MKLAQELRVGNVIKYNNDAYVILRTEYNRGG
ncbi:MAG: elongation factor P, partial [Rhodocyclaceae bacterium]|nr:elongation factor P [Rhodocyclaceae bacterium]